MEMHDGTRGPYGLTVIAGAVWRSAEADRGQDERGRSPYTLFLSPEPRQTTPASRRAG